MKGRGPGSGKKPILATHNFSVRMGPKLRKRIEVEARRLSMAAADYVRVVLSIQVGLTELPAPVSATKVAKGKKDGLGGVR